MHGTTPQGIYIDPQPQSGLRETLEVLRRRKWTILVVTAIVVAAAVGYALLRPTTYTAEAVVLVSGTGTTPGTDDAAEINLETERGLASSTTVATEVVDDLGLDSDPATLAAEIEVDAVSGTEFLNFAYTSSDPQFAADVAEGFADAYLDIRREQVVETLLNASQAIQDRIVEKQGELDRVNEQLSAAADGPTAVTLQSEANSLVGQIAVLEQQVAALTPPEHFQVGLVTEPAAVPSAPSGPNLAMIIALALAAGLGLGIGLALLRDRLDDSIRRIGDVEFTTQAPVLVTAPVIREWRRDGRELLDSLQDIDAPETEAYRALRTSILYGAKHRRIRSVLVTSATAGEGKSTVAANLAVALARAGRKVVLVSADLRRPRLHRIFRSEETVGITNVLADEVDLVDALRPAEFENLRILHTGPVPANPAELLGSSAMERMIDELEDKAEFVLVDAAPVIGVADAVSLAPYVDAVLLVIDAKKTNLNLLGQTIHTLNQVSAYVLGSVLNNVSDTGLSTYSSRYGYYQTHTDADQTSVTSSRRT